MSGLSRTPGKRVRVNSPSGVRIPLSPPQMPAQAGILHFGGERAQALRPVRAGAERGLPAHAPAAEPGAALRKAGHAKPGRARFATGPFRTATRTRRGFWIARL